MKFESQLKSLIVGLIAGFTLGTSLVAVGATAAPLSDDQKFKMANEFAIKATASFTAGKNSVASIMEILETNRLMPLAETNKVREYFNERGLLNVAVKMSYKSDAIAFGKSFLKQREDGDLATSDGRLLGLNRSASYSSLVIRTFERLTEKPSASIMNLVVERASAEEMRSKGTFVDRAGEAAVAAVNAGIYKFLAGGIWVESKIDSVFQCFPKAKVDFNSAKERDEVRKIYFGSKAGRFVCDASAKPYGVKRFVPEMNQVEARNAARAQFAEQMNSVRHHQSFVQCVVNLNSALSKEIEKVADVYVEQEEIDKLIPSYLLAVGPAPFRCTDETLQKLSDFEIRRAEVIKTVREMSTVTLLKLKSNIAYSPKGCFTYKNASPEDDCRPIKEFFEFVGAEEKEQFIKREEERALKSMKNETGN